MYHVYEEDVPLTSFNKLSFYLGTCKEYYEDPWIYGADDNSTSKSPSAPSESPSESEVVNEDYEDDEFTLATTTSTTPSPPPFLVSTSPSPLDEAPFNADTNELLLPEQPRSLSNSFNKLNSFSNSFSKSQDDIPPKGNNKRKSNNKLL